MTINYTARSIFSKGSKFSKSSGAIELSWDKYIAWSKLTHLTELITLDRMYDEDLVVPDYKNAEDWNYIVDHGIYLTDLYTTQDYVLRKVGPVKKFNLLAAAIEPKEDCKSVLMEDFEFVGYELLDQSFSISALTNCGGFNNTFKATDLNRFGLITDFAQALDIRRRLLENNLEEYHADTILIAVWRHKTYGQQCRNKVE